MKNKKRTRTIKIPYRWDPPGKATPDEAPIYVNKRELLHIQKTLGATGKKGPKGLLSFYMDDDTGGTSPKGTTGIGTGSSSSSSSSSGTGARGPTGPTGSPSRTGSNQAAGASSTSGVSGGKPSGSNSQQGGANTSSGSGSARGPSGPQGQNSGFNGGGSNRSGGNNTGGNNTGSNNAGGNTTGNRGTTGPQGQSSGDKGGVIGGASPVGSTKGDFGGPSIGSLTGPARPSGTGSLLGATSKPTANKAQDRVDPNQPRGGLLSRDPVYDTKNPVGYIDNTPATPEELKKGYGVDPGFNSPEAQWQQGLERLRQAEKVGLGTTPTGESPMGNVNYIGEAEAKKAGIANPYDDYNTTGVPPTIDDVVDWGKKVIAAQKGKLGHTAIGPQQITTTNIKNISKELGLPGDTPLGADTYNRIASKMVQNDMADDDLTLHDWDESIGKTPKERDRAIANFNAGVPGTGVTGVTSAPQTKVSTTAAEPRSTKEYATDRIAPERAFTSPSYPDQRPEIGHLDPTRAGFQEPSYPDYPEQQKPQIGGVDPIRAGFENAYNPLGSIQAPARAPQIGDPRREEMASRAPRAPSLVNAPQINDPRREEMASRAPRAPDMRSDTRVPDISDMNVPGTNYFDDINKYPGTQPVPEKIISTENLPEYPTGARRTLGIRPGQYTGSIAGLFNAPKLGQTPDQQLEDEGIQPAPAPDTTTPPGQVAKTILGEEPALIGPNAPHRQPGAQVAEGEQQFKTGPATQQGERTPQQTTPSQDPTKISPEIAVHPRVANSVEKQYGPDMAKSILNTVSSLKGVANRRGGNQPSSYQDNKRVPYKPAFDPRRPVGAPTLEA